MGNINYNSIITKYIDDLLNKNTLSDSEFVDLLTNFTDEDREYAAIKARSLTDLIYGKEIYMRGLVEISNYCKNDCLYCGIRKSNKNAKRYRLNKEDILACCKEGYRLGFRTFVLQGGEDPYFSDDILADIISTIRMNYTDCAITLSLGERSYESYLKLYEAGANRYLLRHETANKDHYQKLHPDEMNLSDRIECLNNLKKIGYQVGCGLMVGSPYQTINNLVEDLRFINKFSPHMVGIGPFIPHKDTPFNNFKQGDLAMTLFLLSIIRIMNPKVLLPSTTALGTIAPNGRELGIVAGANVIMPNISPLNARKKYLLYDNKICTNEEAEQCRGCISNRINSIGYELVEKRGDYQG